MEQEIIKKKREIISTFLKKGILISSELLKEIDNPDNFLALIKKEANNQQVPLKELYYFLRIALTGVPTGPGIGELIAMLGVQDSKKRIVFALELIGR